MTAPASTRVAVVGAGLAGSLLAWRIAQLEPDCRVTLLGPAGRGDATAASGGLVRGYEPDPAASAAATESLAELHGSPVLREWSGYREIGSVFLCPTADGVAEVAAAVADRLGAQVRLVRPDELFQRYGLSGLPEAAVGVQERRAGYFSPDRLRDAVLAELPGLGVERIGATVSTVEQGGCRVDGRWHRFDAVVVAVGRWTGALLAASGLPADGYRAKLVQYGVMSAVGPDLPAFVDDTSGLYGRSAPDGHALLGLPSHTWDVAPDRPLPDHELGARVARVAAIRLPRHRFGPPRLVASADCYTDPPGLWLRPVPGCPTLYTFTGGSGGCAKSALAASRTAAGRLTGAPLTTIHIGGKR